MRRKVSGVLILLSLLIFTACGAGQVSEKEAAQAASKPVATAVPNDSYHIDYYPWDGDYDYYFYLQGCYFSSDGNGDKLYIQPVTFSVEEDETGAPTFKEMGKVIELPINSATQFHIIDWHHSDELIEKSINKPEYGEVCALDDAVYFFDYMRKDYSEKFSSYPLCLNLTEDGYVERVIELWLP